MHFDKSCASVQQFLWFGLRIFYAELLSFSKGHTLGHKSTLKHHLNFKKKECYYGASIAYHLFGPRARGNHQRRQAIVVVHNNVHFAVVPVPCGIERWPQCTIVVVVVIVVATSAFTAAVSTMRVAAAAAVATVTVTVTMVIVMVVMAAPTVGMRAGVVLVMRTVRMVMAFVATAGVASAVRLPHGTSLSTIITATVAALQGGAMRMMMLMALSAPSTQGSIFRIKRQRAYRKRTARTAVHSNALQVTPLASVNVHPDAVRAFLRLQELVLRVGFGPQERAPPQQELHNFQVTTFHGQVQRSGPPLAAPRGDVPTQWHGS